ncbi:helix-turn-helix domain-containing protein [Streptomyces atratus]|uniref:helix-turn-helix domain-containing protein n=1 Tax=Streptomyces atratus TaxID=1893 RepID=UPI00386B0ED6
MAYGHKTPHQARQRATIVLLAARGHSNARIAAQTRMHVDTVRTWRCRFAAGGLRSARYRPDVSAPTDPSCIGTSGSVRQQFRVEYGDARLALLEQGDQLLGPGIRTGGVVDEEDRLELPALLDGDEAGGQLAAEQDAPVGVERI